MDGGRVAWLRKMRRKHSYNAVPVSYMTGIISILEFAVVKQLNIRCNLIDVCHIYN